jgi:hypothetical protein
MHGVGVLADMFFFWQRFQVNLLDGHHFNLTDRDSVLFTVSVCLSISKVARPFIIWLYSSDNTNISSEHRPNYEKKSDVRGTWTRRCCTKLQAMQYKYLGENTVQMNRCVLNSVQAAMTATTLAVVKTVNKAK